MKSFAVAAAVSVALLSSNVESFVSPSSSTVRSNSVAVFQYVPDGFTKESYKKFLEDEKKRKAPKNLGGMGPRGFKSRSMQSFQEAMERGEAEHLMPVFNAEERVRNGELKREDIPYMQRGGSWDNSDVKGAKKKRWLSSDKEYSGGGFRKEQSVSIFGKGAGLDWTGTRSRTGPSETVPGAAPKFGFGYRAPNVNNIKGIKASAPAKKQPSNAGFNFFGAKKKVEPVEEKKPEPKKFFGMF